MHDETFFAVKIIFRMIDFAELTRSVGGEINQNSFLQISIFPPWFCRII